MVHCANHMFLLVDNSDSPSIVEQLQQGRGSDCYTIISGHSWLYDVLYALWLSASLLQHAYIQLYSCSCSAFPVFFFSITLSILLLGFAAPFIQGVFLLNPGIACLTMCTLG